jgi:hypothetical protein
MTSQREANPGEAATSKYGPVAVIVGAVAASAGGQGIVSSSQLQDVATQMRQERAELSQQVRLERGELVKQIQQQFASQLEQIHRELDKMETRNDDQKSQLDARMRRIEDLMLEEKRRSGGGGP